MTPPSVSIVVPTFRRPAALLAMLRRVSSLDYPKDRYEVIVVDDDGGGSSAQIAEDVKRQGVQITVGRQDHRGAASARNHGARVASGDLLLFVDDDILIEPDHLRRHRAARERHPQALISGAWRFAPNVAATLESTPFGRYRLELERSFRAEATGCALADGCREMAMLASTNLAVERERFWELGGFDERFPVAGAEDQDFSIRARAAGCVLLLDPTIRCLHNDNRLTLRAYCEREERSAKTMPLLVRKHPEQFGDSAYVRENTPPLRNDPKGLVFKKRLRWALSRQPVLQALHALTAGAERIRMPERMLQRLYRLLLGLHLFRGFRSTWGK